MHNRFVVAVETVVILAHSVNNGGTGFHLDVHVGGGQFESLRRPCKAKTVVEAIGVGKDRLLVTTWKFLWPGLVRKRLPFDNMRDLCMLAGLMSF